MGAEGAGNYGFDCLLIDLVRQNDVLWRKSNPDHFNETAKKKTWQGIAQSLNESGMHHEPSNLIRPKLCAFKSVFWILHELYCINISL
jgi:hypothetical protein